METRKCAHCSNEFPYVKPKFRQPEKRYCSQRCKRREQERRRRKRRYVEGAKTSDPALFLRGRVAEPVEREGVPFPLTQRLPGSYESGKRR